MFKFDRIRTFIGVMILMLLVGRATAVNAGTDSKNIILSPADQQNEGDMVWDFGADTGRLGWGVNGWECEDFWGNPFWVLDPRENGDPWIVKDDLYLDNKQYWAIQMLVSSNAISGDNVFWKTSNSNYYSGEKSKPLSITPDGVGRVLTIRVNDNPYWMHYVTGLRLDLAENGRPNTCGGQTDVVLLDWVKVLFDNAAPAISFLNSPPANTWYNTDQNIYWNVSDGQSGVAGFSQGWSDPGYCTQFPGATGGYLALSWAGDGVHTVNVRACDNAGKQTLSTLGWFGLDRVAPSNPTGANSGCTTTSGVWQNTCSNANFTWSGAGDTGSGVQSYAYYWGTSNGADPATWTTSAGYNPDPIASGSTYYLRVKTKDNAGNISSPTTLFTLRYDNTAPTNPTAVDPGCTATNDVWQNTCSDSNFTWSGAGDTGSGVQSYAYYWGTSNGADPATWTTSAGYNPGPIASGSTYYLRVKTKDNAGNVSSPVTLFTLHYDNTAPTNPTLVAPGCTATNDVWQNTCSDANFTWSGAGDTGSGVQSYAYYWGTSNGADPATWTTSAGYNPGPIASGSTYYLRVKTKDNAGNVSSPVTLFTLHYDNTAPTNPTLVAPGCTATNDVWQTTCSDANFTWDGAADTDSGVLGYFYYWGPSSSADPATWTTSAGYDPGPIASGSTYYLRLKTKDNAGNLSPAATQFVLKYDGDVPTGTIEINQGAEYASAYTVTLSLSAADIGSGLNLMQVSNSADFAGAAWEPYQGSKVWNLGAVQGQRHVYARFQDAVGLVSAVVEDSILVDTIPPVATILINSGDARTPTREVSLALSAADATPVQMAFSNDVVGFSGWQDFTSTTAWTLGEGDGEKTVSVLLKDAAGNMSSITSDTIFLDLPPVGTLGINQSAADTVANEIKIILDAQDEPGGICSVNLSNGDGNWSISQPYAASLDWTLPEGDGLKTVSARLTSCVGYSSILSDVVRLDTSLAGAYGTLTINSSSAITATTPNAVLWAKGYPYTAWVRYADTPDLLEAAAWDPYATRHTWTLSCDASDQATVYAEFKSADGIIHAAQDSIACDFLRAATPYEHFHNSALSAGAWSAFAGQGVNALFGDFSYATLDLSMPGRGLPVTFARTYHSAHQQDGPLGPGWIPSYALSMTVESAASLLVHMPDGRLDRYTLQDGVYAPPPGVDNHLAAQAGGYGLTTKDQTRYELDPSGKLAAVIDRNENRIAFTYDPQGRLTTITDSVGRAFDLEYDPAGHVTSLTDPGGRRVRYVYTNGYLTGVTDPGGFTTTFGYDTQGLLVTLTDANQHTQLTNLYDTEGRVVRQTDLDGKSITFAYDYYAGRIEVTDRRGSLATYQFDERYRLSQVRNALGHAHTTRYDAHNRLISLTDPRGYTSRFEYDRRGNLQRAIDALGEETAITYNAGNQPLTITDALGRVTHMEYDGHGNLLRSTDPLGYETSFTYDLFGQATGMTDANGRTTQMAYNPTGSLTQITDALNQATGLAYDGWGRVTSIENPRGASTGFQYDANNQLLGTTDALSNTASSQYDAVGNRLETTNSLENSTGFGYDDLNRLVQSTDALGNITHLAYDANGNLVSTTDALGRATTFVYDALNQRVEVQDALGNVTHSAYDPNGNLIASTDASGKITTLVYDALNRLISTTDPLGNQTLSTYDAVGNRSSLTDARGQTTRYAYDANNHLNRVTDAAGNTVTYYYDGVGNQTAIVNPNGAATQYVYDEANRVISTSDALGNTTTYTYDAAGNLAGKTDANGQSVSYAYDLMNRLAQVIYPDNTITYHYDAVGNRTHVIDIQGVTLYEYDELNRIKSVTNPEGQTVGYEYDALGRRSRLIYPDGRAVAYTYDEAGRLATVTDWDAHVTSYTYDARGQLSRIAYPNATRVTYTYDWCGRLTGITHTGAGGQALLNITYELDATGNRTSMTDNRGTENYSYDNLNRLAQVTYANGEIVTYTYDALGNRLSMTSSQLGLTTYTYNLADQLQSLTNPDGTSLAVTWDRNGNMTAKDATRYLFDSANRLTQVIEGDNVVLFTYDGDGHRLSKTVNGEKSIFASDLNTSLPQVLVETRAGQATAYTYGLSLNSVDEPGQGWRYYHADGLGSVRALSDDTGQPAAGYDYDVFGATRGQSGDSGNAFTFTGQQADVETGLMYLRARYYDPAIGRFINKDTFNSYTNNMPMNKYFYAHNDPINFIDPSGHTEINDFIAYTTNIANEYSADVGISVACEETMGTDDYCDARQILISYGKITNSSDNGDWLNALREVYGASADTLCSIRTKIDPRVLLLPGGRQLAETLIPPACRQAGYFVIDASAWFGNKFLNVSGAIAGFNNWVSPRESFLYDDEHTQSVLSRYNWCDLNGIRNNCFKEYDRAHSEVSPFSSLTVLGLQYLWDQYGDDLINYLTNVLKNNPDSGPTTLDTESSTPDPDPDPEPLAPLPTIHITSPFLGTFLTSRVAQLSAKTTGDVVLVEFLGHYATDPNDIRTAEGEYEWRHIGWAQQFGDTWRYDWDLATIPDQFNDGWGTVGIKADYYTCQDTSDPDCYHPGDQVHVGIERGPLTWDFTNDSLGWRTNDADFSGFDGLAWKFDPGSDPWIQSPAFSESAEQYNAVLVVMDSRAANTNGRIYFTTQSSPNYSDDKWVAFTLKPNGSYRLYRIPMSQHPSWKGIITGLRLDPVDTGDPGSGSDYVYVDSIQFVSLEGISRVNWAPNGTLVKGNDETVYLVENGRLRPFPSATVFESCGYNWNSIVNVSANWLNRPGGYLIGPGVTLCSGALLKGSGPAVYAIENSAKRLICSGDVFTAMGYDWDDIRIAPDELLNALPNGSELCTGWSKHPDGTVVKGSGEAVYQIDNGQNRFFANMKMVDSWGRSQDIVTISDDELNGYPAGSPMAYREGTLLKGASPAVYFLEAGKLRLFPSAAEFEAFGYRWGNILEDLNNQAPFLGLPEGPILTQQPLLLTSNLAISPLTPLKGETVTASFTISNASNLTYTAQSIVVSVAGQPGLDFQSPLTSVIFAPWQKRTSSQTNSFTATGNYHIRVAYLHSSNWDIAQPAYGQVYAELDFPVVHIAAPVFDPILNPDGDVNYTITWSSVPNAVSYQLQESNTGDIEANYYDAGTVGSATTWSGVNRPPGGNYYRVRAIDSHGNPSLWSKAGPVSVPGVEPAMSWHPDATLIQNGPGYAAVSIIEDGKRRLFPNQDVFYSYYPDFNGVVTISQAEYADYDEGAMMPFRDSTLLQLEGDAAVWIIDQGQKRWVCSDVFESLGYQWAAVRTIPASSPERVDYFNQIDPGPTLCRLPDGSLPRHPDGSLLKGPDADVVYLLKDGALHSFGSLEMLTNWGFTLDQVTHLSVDPVALYGAAGAHLVFRDGTVLRGINDQALYVMEHGLKRWFPTMEIFQSFGYQDIKMVPDEQIEWVPNGEIMENASNPPTPISICINNCQEHTDNPLVSVTVAATDYASGVLRVDLSNNGDAPTPDFQSVNFPAKPTVLYETIHDWNLTINAPGDGLKKVWARFMDGTGNMTNWATITPAHIMLDTTSPSGVLTAPLDDAVFTETIHLAASVTAGASGVQYVEFTAYYEGAWHTLTKDYAAPYAYDWATAGIGDQNILLGGTVIDQSDRSAALNTITIFKDSLPPETTNLEASAQAGAQARAAGFANRLPLDFAPQSLDAPAGGGIVSSSEYVRDSATLQLDADDQRSGVETIQFSYLQDRSWVPIGAVTSEPYRLVWDLAGIPDQILHVKAVALDSAGNNQELPELLIVKDTALPGLASGIHLADWPGAYTNDPTPVFAWQPASDPDSGIGGYIAAINDWTPDQDDWLLAPVTSWEAPNALTDGDYFIALTSVDRAGNVNPADTDQPGSAPYFQFTVDTVLPSSSVLSLDAEQSTTSFAISWTGQDNRSGIAGYDIQFRDGEGPWLNWLVDTPLTTTIFRGEDGHAYAFRSRAHDTAGNIEGWSPTPDAQTSVAAAPDVAFTMSDNDLPAGQAVIFTNKTKGAQPLTYLWDFGDGNTSTDSSPNHTYLSAGVYAVVLTASNANGSDTVTGTVIVGAPPVAGFTPADHVVVVNQPLTFTNTTSGTEPLTYAWDFDDGTTAITRDAVHSFAADGVYTVTLSAENNYGTGSITDVITVAIAVQAGFSAAPFSGVAPLDVGFTNQSSGDYTTCAWDFGDSLTSTLCTDPTHTYTMPGVYTATLAISGLGGTDTETKTHYITAYTPAQAEFSATPVSGIAPLNATFTNLSSGDYATCAWTFGDGAASTTCDTPNHNYTQPGVYTVKLTVSGLGGTNTTTKTSYIAVYTPVQADFSATPVTGTAPLDVTFTNLSHGDYSTCAWDFGDGGTSTLCANPAHTYTVPGMYTVTLTIDGLGGTDTETKASFIAVHVPAHAAFSANQVSGIVPLNVTYTNLSSGDYISCAWDFGDGETSTDCTNLDHNYTIPGVYTVTLTINGLGGSDSEKKINYINVYTPVQADFSATPVSGVSPLNVTFTNLSSGSYTTCEWDFGDGETSTDCAGPTHTYSEHRVYTATLTVNGFGGTDTETKPNYITINAPVHADFSATPASGIGTLNVAFANLSSGDYTICFWDFGDHEASSICNPTHSYAAPGVYTVTLTASGAGGTDIETKTGYITVYTPVQAGFTASQVSGISPLDITFANLSSGAFTSCTWDFGDGNTSTLCESPSHNFITPGVYTVTLTVSGLGGTGTETKTNYITIYAPVQADFCAAPVLGVPPLNVTFTNLSGGDFNACAWDFGDGGESMVCTNPAYTYTVPGVYTVTLTASGLGGTDLETKTSYITVYNPVIVDFSATPTNGVAPLNVVFTNLFHGDISACTWDFGDGGTSTDCVAPTHNYIVSGTYTVTLTVSGLGGAKTETKSGYITVYTRAHADFTATPTVGNAALNVIFTNLSSGDYATCTWNFGDGKTSTSCSTLTHNYTAPGVYTVTLIIRGLGGYDEIIKASYIIVNSSRHEIYLPIVVKTTVY